MHRSVMVAALALASAAALALAACGQTTNPAACCTGPTDCPNIGLDEPQACATGLACVDNRCTVASCASTGCTADAPVCDTRSDTCQACTGPGDCAKYGAADQCNADTGACVECVAAIDCGSTTPICDEGSCRACRLDTDCESGACGEDGACVPEAQIAYADPRSTATEGCTRAAPCSTFRAALFATSPTRTHVVLANATYDGLRYQLTSAVTAAASLHVHGHGATLRDGSGEVMIRNSIPARITDVSISYREGIVMSVDAALTLERVKIDAKYGISASASLTARDLEVQTTNYGIYSTSDVVLDRAIISGGATGIETSGSLQLRNVLVHSVWGTGVKASNAAGSIEYSTIVQRDGSDEANDAAVACDPYPTSSLTIRNSILVSSSTTTPTTTGLCHFVSTIVWPVNAPNAIHADPLFRSPGASDYRLGANSPARDAATMGPASDFEGDPRPQGARYDLGADESP